jgi:opacity protein-like surface antigen
MIKRLALLICCILLLPTIAAAQSQVGDTNYGDWWVGGQGGIVIPTDGKVTGLAGAIVGYNFCMPYRPAWQRYFGVALDFQWNHFDFRPDSFPMVVGNQFALTPLARLQYPLMGDDSYTRGRFVPFLMFGPSVVWTSPDHGDTKTNFGIVAEVGLEYFVMPQVSIGPSFRYRHVFNQSFHDNLGRGVDGQLNQYMVLGRLAYHF